MFYIDVFLKNVQKDQRFVPENDNQKIGDAEPEREMWGDIVHMCFI